MENKAGVWSLPRGEIMASSRIWESARDWAFVSNLKSTSTALVCTTHTLLNRLRHSANYYSHKASEILDRDREAGILRKVGPGVGRGYGNKSTAESLDSVNFCVVHDAYINLHSTWQGVLWSNGTQAQ